MFEVPEGEEIGGRVCWEGGGRRVLVVVDAGGVVVVVVDVGDGGFGEGDWGGRTEPLKGGMAVPFRVRVPPMGAVGGMMLGGGAALALVVKASRVLPWIGLRMCCC